MSGPLNERFDNQADNHLIYGWLVVAGTYLQTFGWQDRRKNMAVRRADGCTSTAVPKQRPEHGPMQPESG